MPANDKCRLTLPNLKSDVEPFSELGVFFYRDEQGWLFISVSDTSLIEDDVFQVIFYILLNIFRVTKHYANISV